jgi:transcriptional regulator with XRE-family HTH domain
MIKAQCVYARYRIDGVALCAARQKLGLTMQEVGLLCGWSKSVYCRMENGQVEINDEQLAKLQKIFRIRIEDRTRTRPDKQ